MYDDLTVAVEDSSGRHRCIMRLFRDGLSGQGARGAAGESLRRGAGGASGRLTFGGGGIYTATKHAVHAFSGCLFDDLRDRGLKVSAIFSGFVNTGMTAAIAGDRSHMIQPDDFARTMEFVLEFPANACPTEIVIRPQLPL